MKKQPTTIGEKLLELRKAKGYTQVDIENMTGITQTKLVRIEMDKCKTLKQEDLEKLCNIYGVDLAYLYGFDLAKQFSELPDELQHFVVNKEARQYLTEAYIKYISDKLSSFETKK